MGSGKLGGKAYVYVWLERSYDPTRNATLESMRTLSWFVSYRRLSPQFQFSLSPAALDMYLYDCICPAALQLSTTSETAVGTLERCLAICESSGKGWLSTNPTFQLLELADGRSWAAPPWTADAACPLQRPSQYNSWARRRTGRIVYSLSHSYWGWALGCSSFVFKKNRHGPFLSRSRIFIHIFKAYIFPFY